MNLPVPFFVYWLIVKEYFNSLSHCEGNSTEIGYCMSSLQCSHILNGTITGTCGSETSDFICCYKTLHYYNDTYFMRPMYVERNPPDLPQTVLRLNSKAFIMHPTNYDNITIPSNYELKVVEYNEQVNHCVHPDRILWPITVPYFGEKMDPKFESATTETTYIFLVAFDKVHDEEKKQLTIDCLSKLNESESRESCLPKYYIKVNREELFPLRKLFSPEIQNLRNSNYTDDIERLFERNEPQDRTRRSRYYGTCKAEDSGCEEQNWEYYRTVVEQKKVVDNVPSQIEMTHETQLENYNIKSIPNYVMQSKSVKEGRIDSKETNEESFEDQIEESTAGMLAQNEKYK